MYSPSLLDHNCEVSHQLLLQFQRKHYLIFSSIQYGCKTMQPINYSLTNMYTQGLRNIFVKFPLNLSSRSGEEDFFIGFQVNQIWLPNNAAHDVICVNLLFRIHVGGHTCKVSPDLFTHFREEDF